MKLFRPWLLVCALLAAGACARRPAPATPAPVLAVAPAPTPMAAPTLDPDPAIELIAAADAAFAEGLAHAEAGRLQAARERFDHAVDLLLAAPGGARQDATLSAALDRLLDRVSALDVIALREGDGFTEVQSEPAAIDALLSLATGERPAPTAATANTVAADLGVTPHDLPMTINAKVLSYVELFQGNLRSFIQDGLSRGMPYLPMIEDVFRAEGVPLDLAYVPLIESAFKPAALSRASARGMWQFVQGTALEHGLERTWFVDDRSNPEKATRAAATYLKTLAAMFDGDWELALASYNGGPGRVQRAIRNANTTDFWKMTETTRYLPRETREYVPMIFAAVIIGRNPARYGFDIGAAPPLTFDRVLVPDALDLKFIAEWAGVTVDEIRELNPDLRRTTTPASAHELKVPLGTGATIEARLATLDRSLFATYTSHVVKTGETLTSIAKQYKLTVAQLRQYNDLRASARVTRGQTLMIPERRAAALPPRPGAASAAAPAASAATVYRVRSGDTLSSIARQFNTTVGTLKRLNELSSDVIRVGDRLTVRR